MGNTKNYLLNEKSRTRRHFFVGHPQNDWNSLKTGTWALVWLLMFHYFNNGARFRQAVFCKCSLWYFTLFLNEKFSLLVTSGQPEVVEKHDFWQKMCDISPKSVLKRITESVFVVTNQFFRIGKFFWGWENRWWSQKLKILKFWPHCEVMDPQNDPNYPKIT